MTSSAAQSTSPSAMDNHRLVETMKQHQQQVESTLYMPSMYDSDDGQDETSDTRDERMSSDRQNVLRMSKFSLQRCLAWSIDEQEEERVAVRDEQFAVDERNNALATIAEGGGVQSFGSFHSALVDSVNSRDIHIHNGVRPIHWEEQVTVDKKLDSFLSLTSSASEQFATAS
jgi:hypothetical protein